MNNEQITNKAVEAYPVREKMNKKGTGTFDPNLPRREAYIKGYKQGANDRRHEIICEACDILAIYFKQMSHDDIEVFRNAILDV